MSGTANSSDLPPWVEVFCKHTDCRAYRNPLSHELYKLLKIIKIRCGGERGIRTLEGSIEPVSYRFLVVVRAIIAGPAVAHYPKLPKCAGRGRGPGCSLVWAANLSPARTSLVVRGLSPSWKLTSSRTVMTTVGKNPTLQDGVNRAQPASRVAHNSLISEHHKVCPPTGGISPGGPGKPQPEARSIFPVPHASTRR